MHRLEKTGSEFSLTSILTLDATIMLQILKGMDAILRVRNSVSLNHGFGFVIGNKMKLSKPRHTAAGRIIEIVSTVLSLFLPA